MLASTFCLLMQPGLWTPSLAFPRFSDRSFLKTIRLGFQSLFLASALNPLTNRALSIAVGLQHFSNSFKPLAFLESSLDSSFAHLQFIPCIAIRLIFPQNKCDCVNSLFKTLRCLLISISMTSQIFVALHNQSLFYLPSFVSQYISYSSFHTPTTKTYSQNPPHSYTSMPLLLLCPLPVTLFTTLLLDNPHFFIKIQIQPHLLHCILYAL